jgi:hypothetical protein
VEWFQRLKDKRNTLAENVLKLESALKGDILEHLDEFSGSLLKEQYFVMLQYLTILDKRIGLIDG